jgi:membrane protease YdiL (CAAX protease family)
MEVALDPLSFLPRLLGPAAAACAAAWALDWSCRRKGLMPPGFRRPWRRAAAFMLVAGILWVGIFLPLGYIGLEPRLDLSSLSTPRLFLLHVLMGAAVLGWFALGFAAVGRPGAETAAGRPAAPAGPGGPDALPGVPEVSAAPGAPAGQDAVAAPVSPSATQPGPGAGSAAQPGPGAGSAVAAPRQPSFGRQLAAQLGLVAPKVSFEVMIGLLLGVAAWMAVLAALLAAAIAVYALGGESALPKPSAIVPWIAALPVLVRVMVALSAGFVEEIFFRGFLQPRIGILLSTGFFALAHVSYGQPFMLLGVTLLSLIYALLVRWRQTIWPAIVAHALFDGIQLLVIIPLALRVLGKPAGSKAVLAVISGVSGLERLAAGAIW